jgi:hypothetical protein
MTSTSLNLSKHGAEMQKAWKDVISTDTDTDWALFGYADMQTTR